MLGLSRRYIANTFLLIGIPLFLVYYAISLNSSDDLITRVFLGFLASIAGAVLACVYALIASIIGKWLLRVLKAYRQRLHNKQQYTRMFELKSLRDAGLYTDEEFTIELNKIKGLSSVAEKDT